MDFFLAASNTTMYGSQSMIGHFATATESLRKLRTEFALACSESDDFDRADLEMGKLDFLKKYVTL